MAITRQTAETMMSYYLFGWFVQYLNIRSINNRGRIGGKLPIFRVLITTHPPPIIILMAQEITLSSLPPRRRGSYLNKCPTVNLTSNLFKVNIDFEKEVVICATRIVPRISSLDIRDLYKECHHQIEAKVGPFIYSGKNLFTTACKFTSKEITFDIGMISKYSMTVRKLKTIKIKDLKSEDRTKNGVVYLFLNNVMKNLMGQLDYTEIGRSKKYYDPKKKEILESVGIIVFSGFSTRFNLLQNGLFLQVAGVNKIIRTESTLQVINKVYAYNNHLSKSQKRLLIQQTLVNKMVMANYGKCMYYIIKEVIFDANLETYKFQTFGSSANNLFEYYFLHYGIEIKNRRQPLLKANQTLKSCAHTDVILVPELLLMSGLPEDLDERKRREMCERTLHTPTQKLRALTQLMQELKKGIEDFNLNSIDEKLGIEIEVTPTKVEAKKFSTPVLQLRGKEKVDENKVSAFVLSKPIFDSSAVLKICLIIPMDDDVNCVKNIMDEICNNLSLTYTMKLVPFNFSDEKNLKHRIKTVITQERNVSNICWFIIPFKAKHHYKDIKKETTAGANQMITQFTVFNTLKKKNFIGVITGILLQMAVKIGNKLWAPKIPQAVQEKGVMIVSIESYYDSENKRKVINAYCSTVDKIMTEFNSNYSLQDLGQQLKMKEIISDCLTKYIKKNGLPPSEVIFLKNGTVKWDVGVVLAAEIQEIKMTYKVIPSCYSEPKTTYIIVDKNSKQQFYLQRGHQSVNPYYGTLINSKVTSPQYDFYMYPYNCNRGSAKPTYYKVVYSDSAMEEGVLEELIYLQCFNYANWSGAIKVPGPMQYARKLATFMAQNIGKEGHGQEMTDKLYYI